MSPLDDISSDVQISSSVGRRSISAANLQALREASNVPCTKKIANISLRIFEMAEKNFSTTGCLRMVAKVNGLFQILIVVHSTNSGIHSIGLLDGLEHLTKALDNLDSFLRTRQKSGKFKRFLMQREMSAQVRECDKELERLMNMFSTHLSMTRTSRLIAMRVEDERVYREIVEQLGSDDPPDDGTTSSVQSSSMETGYRLENLKDNFSSLSLEMLPNMPQIFHGRDKEIKGIVDTLLQNDSRVAILGPAGIGKTSLARAALNHAYVTEKYLHQRYWVSCESAPTVGDLISSVALALGLEAYGGGISNAVIRTLAATSACLLVLDNLETPWEARNTRNQVEGFLALVADIPHVSLLITMRGQERPLNVRWTRPFLPPLMPVSDIAARQIFSDISDIEDETSLGDVLSHTGNLPLAVTLMASVASVEGCNGTLTRWKREKLSLLSEGHFKESNLEMSLRFSLSSPRIKSNPEVLRLLGLLSLLPDGASDDVLSNASPSNHFLRDKLTLLRTSLAYHGTDGRLKSLPPIREFVKKINGPTAMLAREVRLYLESALKFWSKDEQPSNDDRRRLLQNLGNITSLLEWELSKNPTGDQLREAAYEIFLLDNFSGRNTGSGCLLMDRVDVIVERLDDPILRGLLILRDFQNGLVPETKAVHLSAQGKRYFSQASDCYYAVHFQNTVGDYYYRDGDVQQAECHWKAALSLASKTNYKAGQYFALCNLARLENRMAQFQAALLSARKAQKIAGIIGFQIETMAIIAEAEASVGLGDLARGLELCAQGQRHLAAVGPLMADTPNWLNLVDFEAEIYLRKTEYLKSRHLNDLIVRSSSSRKLPLLHANSLANILHIDIILGAVRSREEMISRLAPTQEIFATTGYRSGMLMCDQIHAEFLLHSGRPRDAKNIYERCVRSRSASESLRAAVYSKLGDIRLGLGDRSSTLIWATIYLAVAMKSRNPLWLASILRLFADLVRVHGDRKSTKSLFIVSLDEFTRLDVPRGKGDCLLGLAEIARAEGNSTEEKARFEEARSMFERSGIALPCGDSGHPTST
ncbi:hypothetical protein C8R43DRAFT_933201 [Mycena crocata]|nr:hypothetical protein C8R43DRAFT_933201 [Mycena crocata]